MKLVTPQQWVKGYVDKALARGITYTSLDAMKLFAIVNMTADHVGFYLYPHDLWWRAIGRITFPVWFFLVGYSRARSFGKEIFIYTLLLIIACPVLGYRLFPLNALFSIILCRLILNFCDDCKLLPGWLPLVAVTCAILTYVTTPFFEYGSIAFLFALLGRMTLRKEKKHLIFLFTVSYLTFIFWQFIWFKFNLFQGAYVVIGTFAVMVWLATFKNSVIWPDWQETGDKTIAALLSRNTMPYYFYHRLLLEIVAAFLMGRNLYFHLRF